MAVEPIRARCRACGQQLLLPEVVEGTSGRCPSCDELLAPGYTFLLLEEARRAEALQRALILSLRRLQGLPGNLSLDVGAVMRNALAGIDWHEQLVDDRAVMREGAAQLAPRARQWRWLRGPERRAQAPGLVASIRSLAQRLRRHADHVEEHGGPPAAAQPDPAALRAAADQVDASADAVASDRRRCDELVRDAVAVANASLRDDGAGSGDRPQAAAR